MDRRFWTVVYVEMGRSKLVHQHSISIDLECLLANSATFVRRLVSVAARPFQNLCLTSGDLTVRLAEARWYILKYIGLNFELGRTDITSEDDYTMYPSGFSFIWLLPQVSSRLIVS